MSGIVCHNLYMMPSCGRGFGKGSRMKGSSKNKYFYKVKGRFISIGLCYINLGF